MYTVALVCIRVALDSCRRIESYWKKTNKIYFKKEEEDFEAHAIASIFVFYPSRRVCVGCRGSDS
jgi:hypothetical protein